MTTTTTKPTDSRRFGNLVFHDATGLPTAVFAAGSWTRAETAANPIPDAPPANLTETNA